MNEETATTDQGQAEAPATTEAADSQESLDALLDEYKGTEPAPETVEEKPSAEEEPAWAKELRKEVKELRADSAEAKVGDAISKSVARIVEFSDATANQPPELIEGFLRMRAEKDGRVLRAFNDQFQNPGGWEKVVKGLAKEFDGLVSAVPDSKLTGDQKAARDAVKGQSATRPPDSDGPTQAEVSAMSDSDFKAHKAREFAKGA